MSVDIYKYMILKWILVQTVFELQKWATYEY